AQDMPDLLPIRAESTLATYKISDYPALATKKIRFVGECVAICIAPTRAEAEDIAELVELDLEPLDVIVTARDAQKPGAVRVHEEWDDNLFLTTCHTGNLDAARR